MIHAYIRPDGKVGIRNVVAVISGVICVNHIVRKIVENTEGAVALEHSSGCTVGEDLERTERTLAGLGNHPNVAGVLIVGLGCETANTHQLFHAINSESPWKPLEKIIVQELGVSEAIRKGRFIVKEMVVNAAQATRQETELSHLTLAVECGGSDATSGLAANPGLGVAVDRLIDAGGSVMFSETTETFGAENVLIERAVNENVAEQLIERIEAAKDRMTKMLSSGEHFLASGNIEGGLTTLEEKSLGAICKSGTRQIHEVVNYGEKPSCRGLVFTDGTGFDVSSLTGMVAGGAQIVAFTTGKGSPVGYPIVPVIKITGNPDTFERMKESMDINAGTIIRGKKSVQNVGDEIFEEIIKVASGKQTQAEIFGFMDFDISTFAGAHAGF